MKKIKKIYVITLEEKYHSITDISVLGTFSNERSWRKFAKGTKRRYSGGGY